MNKIYLKIPRKEITYLNKILEGYDHLGVVSTIDPREGLVMVHHTPDTREEVRRILQNMPFIEEFRDG